jgi:periplasmic protein TonB
MTTILHQENTVVDHSASTIVADFLMPDRRIEEIVRIKKPKKPKPQKEQALQQPTFKMKEVAVVSEKLQFDIPLIKTDIKISMTMPEASSDSDYIPVLKVAPIYPQRAANRNIEGYVVVEYTISNSGQVINVKVVEAKPKGVFDKSAIEAAKRFKYKPRKVEGKNVAVKGVKNKFTFVLED